MAETNEPSTNPARRWKRCLAILVCAGAAILLFARLGHYALWDDEAGTALSAIGVWRTGDTTAVLDHNIAAYESGKDLVNLHERLMPPLPAYLAAPFIGLLGRTAFAARLPFALCGAACVALMVWWLLRSKPRSSGLLFFGAALLTNVSFFLFCRQCRYYAPAILSSTALAWLYLHYDGRRWKVILFAIVSICLFASNYLDWGAFYVCLALDYWIWGRRRFGLKPADWAIVIIPQLVLGGLIFWIWNPLRILGTTESYPVAGKLVYLWWCIRDIVACEFVAPIFVLLALVFCLRDRKANSLLLRACLALGVYIVVLGFLVQRPPSLRGVAAVRYFTPIIPLCIAIAVLGLSALYNRSKWAAILLALAGLGNNLLNPGSQGVIQSAFHSTVVRYLQELIHPPLDPYSVTADWLNKNLHHTDSVWVLPDYATYPLMFHAPAPIYAWQLTWPPAKPEFQNLPLIHFIGRTPPDYIIGFGPATELATSSIASWNRPDIHYAQAATFDCFWQEMHRPELFWRTFNPITNYDRKSEAIYVFKLMPASKAATK